MYQTIETTDKEKYDMYNSLEKDVLIGMLIECNKHLQRIKPRVDLNRRLPDIVAGSCGYFSGTDTSGRCNTCGKQQYEH